MPRVSPRSLVYGPVAAASILGAALVALSLVAARALSERDAAAREGVLLRVAHELEARLREAGPTGAADVLARACEEREADLSGLELWGARGLVARCGVAGTDAIETTVFLGREWRGLGVVDGGEAGEARGRGFGGPPRFVLRLTPSPALGQRPLLSTLLVTGAVSASSLLVALALLAARGLAHRQRLLELEAERSRLDAVALAGAGLAHRIRNPLGAVKGTAQLLASGGEGTERERAERIVAASERIETLVSRLLQFARPPEPHPETLDLAALARDVAARPPGGCRVDAPAPVTAVADREHAEGVLEELLANARAADPGAELVVTARSEGSLAVVEVADRGPGLAVEPSRAFEPWVTTRAEGTGLGLAIVRGLARANGGEVTLASREGGGCLARLTLPAKGT